MCNSSNNSDNYTNKYPGFIDRLITLRKSKNFKTKTQFAEWLGVPRNTYSMIESGYRPPTKQCLERLLIKTGLPEEYWLHGVETTDEFVSVREEFKMCRKSIDDIIALDLLNEDGLPKNEESERLIATISYAAFKADMAHIVLKKKRDALKKQGI